MSAEWHDFSTRSLSCTMQTPDRTNHMTQSDLNSYSSSSFIVSNESMKVRELFERPSPLRVEEPISDCRLGLLTGREPGVVLSKSPSTSASVPFYIFVLYAPCWAWVRQHLNTLYTMHMVILTMKLSSIWNLELNLVPWAAFLLGCHSSSFLIPANLLFFFWNTQSWVKALKIILFPHPYVLWLIW